MRKLNNLKIWIISYARCCETHEVVSAYVKFEVGDMKATIELDCNDYLTDIKEVEEEILNALDCSCELDYFDLISVKNGVVTFNLNNLDNCEVKFDAVEYLDEDAIKELCFMILENTFDYVDEYDKYGCNNCDRCCRRCDYEMDCRISSDNFKEIRQHELDAEMLEDILEDGSDEYIQATIDMVQKVRNKYADEVSDLDGEKIYECLLKAVELQKSFDYDSSLVEALCEHYNIHFEYA
ncbi:hypothetical protein QOZ83_15655, partial [Romboutsia sedimentorum]|uniref:hypothetical protein n=1 Tax=Romboutsia sedimentorum TaxID=1368474 RepID=UPI0024DEF508